MINSPPPTETTAIIVVDHGSRRDESNQKLLAIVDRFRKKSRFQIIEPAHMELASPSIADAFTKCVQAGAELVIVHPFFLLPGRHWNEDIPNLVTAAAAEHPGVKSLVTAPLGLHPMLLDVIASRIDDCLAHAEGNGDACELCEGTTKCEFKS